MENEIHIVPSDAQAEIAQIREDANVLLYKAEEVAAIKSTENEARGVEFIAQVKRRAKIVDEKRKTYTAPLNAALKNINADFGNILKPLEEAERIVKAGIQRFRDTEAFRLREEARLKAEAEAEAAVRSIENGQTSQAAIDAAAEKLAVAAAANAEAPRTVATQSGQLRTRKVRRFEIVDAGVLPREYLVPDEKKIRDAINQGTEIPGVRSWDETVPIIMS